LLYFALVSTTVAVGIQVSGTLLAGALVIVPAVGAKLIGGNLRTFATLSAVFGALIVTTGTAVASGTSFPPGPLVVVLGVVRFAVVWVRRMLGGRPVSLWKRRIRNERPGPSD
jgi:zinc transport system permease protein